MDMLFFLGIATICGFLVGKLSNKLHFPQVIGYLIAGVILGPSFLGVFDLELLDKFKPFNDFALGLVAFIIGSEMHIGTLRKMGKGIINIIFSESFVAFTLVFLGVYLLTRKLYVALIFGALAPASAPAGTVAVLQEYRAKGPLTKTLYAVVGLDDGLAIMIYGFAAALARLFVTGEGMSFANLLRGPGLEIIGSIALGGVFGLLSGYFINKLRERTEVLAASLIAILLCTGLSNYFHLSIILSNLSLGMVFANLFLTANRRAFRTAEMVAYPMYIIFFFIAGAHLQVQLLPAMGLLGLTYILCRILGLMGGATLGAAVSHSEEVIRKYLGFGILSQAGVAIGLAILVNKEFASLGEKGGELALLVINTIAATTIFFEIIGPLGVKFAISHAGEMRKGKK